MVERRLRPKDIARMDEEAYDEPGRDLLATRPAEDAPGDEPNPKAQPRVPGPKGQTRDKLGSDEVNRLAEGRNA